MRKIGYRATIAFILLITLSMLSCNSEEAKPESVIEETSSIKISLSYVIEGESKPFEHTDLDLGLFNSGGGLVSSSENFGEEEISLPSSASNQPYFVKVKRFEKTDDKLVRFTVAVTNSSGGEKKEFQGEFSELDEQSKFSWEDGEIKTSVKIEKNGNDFNVLAP